MSPYLAFGLGVAATYGLSIIAVAVIVIYAPEEDFVRANDYFSAETDCDK
jgi:hypothetical protein